jgi:CRP-like cAMP-binding protein
MTGEAVAALRRSHLFRAVDKGRIRWLARTMRQAKFGKGETVAGVSESEQRLILVTQGTAQASCVSRDGDELILRELHAGDVFGLTLLGRRGTGGNSLIAVSAELDVYFLPLSRVEQAMQEDAALCLRALRLVSESTLELCASSQELAFESMRVRLAHRLAALAREEHGRLVVRHTQRQLAAWIGSQQEEVSRTLRHLSRAGLIRLRPYCSRDIEILDRAGLATYE